MKPRGSLSQWGREFRERYTQDAYMEVIFMDLLFLFCIITWFFDIVLGSDVYLSIAYNPILLFVDGIFCYQFYRKKKNKPMSRKWMMLDLLHHIHQDHIYLIFFIVNLFFFIFILYFSLGIFYFLAIPAFPIFRLIFMGEDTSIQNRILRSGISELESYENITVLSPMVKTSTYQALMKLIRIREHMQKSAEMTVESQKMKTDLITNISHDLKTPLTSIINYTDLLSRKTEMDEEAQNYIQVLGRNSQRLKTLIVGLIEASKTNTGNIKLEPAIIDFNELVNQIYGDFEAQYSQKGLDFLYEEYSDELLIYMDGNILSRIIQNLFSNVYKYALENTKVYGRTYLNRDKLYFSLKNISKEKVERSSKELQSQFIRGERSRSTEGSGLGLYIAKNLTEILGGKFRIVIEDDYFQVFLELPVQYEATK